MEAALKTQTQHAGMIWFIDFKNTEYIDDNSHVLEINSIVSLMSTNIIAVTWKQYISYSCTFTES